MKVSGGIDRIPVRINEFYKRNVLGKTSSLSLHFDPTYAPTEHITTIAEIVGLPSVVSDYWKPFIDSIKNFKHLDPEGTSHLYFDYKALEEDEVVHDEDGNKIYFVELYLVFAASQEVDGETLVSVNTGFTLCSPFYGFGWKNIDIHGNGEMTRVREKSGIIIEMNPSPDERIAYIRHCPVDSPFDVGDIVFREAETNYEYEIAGETVYVVRRENVDGVLLGRNFAHSLVDDVRNEYTYDIDATGNDALAKEMIEDL